MVAGITLTLLLLQATPASQAADDRRTIPEPEERQVANYYDYAVTTLFEPVARLFNFPRDFRKLKGSPKEAENVNRLDDVPDSSWFTRRNFWNPMSPEQIREGPVPPEKRPDSGPWTITKCKSDGVMPGFQIKDHKGDTYLLKFDPPGYLEMATAADVIGSRFLYAAGYNVPENSIVNFNESILVPKAGLSCTGPNLEKTPLTKETISHFLEDVPRTKNGQLRAMASRFIAGKVKGPFSYKGVRKDDPNDRIPHEHRRELRGLRMMHAFINNVDVKQINTLDSYVEEDGRKFLKHYLIDFGDSLGSGSVRPKEAGDGHEYVFDTSEVMQSALTLGIHRRADTRLIHVQYPSIGFIEGAGFDPIRWKSNFPNEAFANMTERDGFWAAKIVATFTDDQITAAVRAGQYSDPAAEQYLIQVLETRRDRMADYWFHRVAPLDRFRMTPKGLVFDDLAVAAHRDAADRVQYGVLIFARNTVPVSNVKRGEPIPIPIDNGRPTEVEIARTSPGWPSLKVTVIVEQVDGKPTITGIRR